MRLAGTNKLLPLLVGALCCFAVIEANEGSGNDSCAAESQLRALQIELTQLYVRTEEQLEAISTKLHQLTQSIDVLTWTVERVERSVAVIEGDNARLVRNVSLLTSQSDQVLLNQQYCANHEALKEMFFDLVPKCTPGSVPKPPPIDNKIYRSCQDAPSRPGVYRISPYSNSSYINVYCEQEKFGGGWMVIQRRQDGTVDFNRSWSDYRNGFGDPNGEVWVGLEHQFQLTNGRPHELLILLENATGHEVYQKYPRYSVNSESTYYTLLLPSPGGGTAGDSFYDYRGEKFLTYDKGAGTSYFSCVDKLASGFWHYSCSAYSRRNNLNGIYGRSSGDVQGIWWGTFGTSDSYSNQLKHVQLMIREPLATTASYPYETTGPA